MKTPYYDTIVSLGAMDMGNHNEFLKECIADALLKLMDRKPYKKISITELTNVANVGRATYFRNFKSKEDVISFKLVICWKHWVEDHDIKEKSEFALDNALTFFEYNYSIKDILVKVYKEGMEASLYDSFSKIMVDSDSDDAFKVYKQRFYSYALFGLLDEWIKRNFKETPLEMSKILKSIV